MVQQGQCQHSLLRRTDAAETSFSRKATAHSRLHMTHPGRGQQDGRRRVASHSPSGPEIYFSLPLTLSTEQDLASDPPAIQLQTATNYNDAQQAIIQGFLVTFFKKDSTAWRQWRRFCSWLKISPNLKDIEDPIPFLQIFAKHVCAGLLSAQGQPIKKRSVEQYLRSIGQIFSSVGADNPRQNLVGKLDFRLGSQLASYQKEDSPPTIVRPLLVSIIQAVDTASQGTTQRNISISNLTCVAFFFLLRPGDTAEAVPTPHSTPSGSRTSNCSLDSNSTTP